VFQDMKINVHISGKLGPAGFLLAYDRLSDVAKNCITIENEEYSFGLDECLTLAAYCPIVLDLHHFWIKEETYFSKEDIRMQQIIDSWRGVRPVIHYSYSRDEHFPKDFTHDNFPDMENLLNLGYKKSKLRAHSNGYPNQTVNKYALSFLDIADIMCEAKLKNLASFELFNQAR
jgi:UV DNA damage endonuclease